MPIRVTRCYGRRRSCCPPRTSRATCACCCVACRPCTHDPSSIGCVTPPPDVHTTAILVSNTFNVVMAAGSQAQQPAAVVDWGAQDRGLWAGARGDRAAERVIQPPGCHTVRPPILSCSNSAREIGNFLRRRARSKELHIRSPTVSPPPPLRHNGRHH